MDTRVSSQDKELCTIGSDAFRLSHPCRLRVQKESMGPGLRYIL